MPEPTAAPSRPTLDAIAQQAAVSLSTVSKVLNGRPGVSAPTRARVEELLHDSGYARRGPLPERGGLIELVVTDLLSEWSVEIIRGVERVTREAGFVLALSALGDHLEPGGDWISGVLNRKPVAVILQFSNLTAEHRQRLRTRNIPFVVVHPTLSGKVVTQAFDHYGLTRMYDDVLGVPPLNLAATHPGLKAAFGL